MKNGILSIFSRNLFFLFPKSNYLGTCAIESIVRMCIFNSSNLQSITCSTR